MWNVRTDYWVSQERKFCEFCKCSISANKASIEFHENGKNHKENVAKRLTEIQKKAAKERKNALDFDNELKRMEAAALRAYVRDIETNPDFTSYTIDRASIPAMLPELPPEKPTKKSGGKHKHDRKPPPSQPQKKWMEALSDEGVPYYWHIETKESVWEQPEEGFLTLDEQKNPSTKSDSSKPGNPSKFKGKKFGKKGGKFGKPKEGANKPKEDKMAEEATPVPLPEFFPIPVGHPYGKWEKVEEKTQEPVDLQLPEQDFVKIVVPNLRGDSEKKFKERKIPAPGSVASVEGETGFKKRKLNAKNMRQRMDDD